MTYLFLSKLRQLDTVAMIVGLQLGHVPLEHGDVTHRDSELSPNLLSVVVELPPGVPEHGDPSLHQGDPLGGGGHGRPVQDGVAGGHGLLVPAVVDRLVPGHLHLQPEVWLEG